MNIFLVKTEMHQSYTILSLSNTDNNNVSNLCTRASDKHWESVADSYINGCGGIVSLVGAKLPLIGNEL